MLIKELVERSGLTMDTILFYEKKGLIAVNAHDSRENKHAEYSEALLQRLLLIRKIKDLGTALNEIDNRLER
jgi:DNA-binding transcriptional MerR regulator